jgi:hypothetical protein
MSLHVLGMSMHNGLIIVTGVRKLVLTEFNARVCFYLISLIYLFVYFN